jgi:hypothetical protein
MESKPFLTIDLDSCSPKTLFELYQQLKDSEHNALRTEIQRKLVECVRKTGRSTQYIVDLLIAGVGTKTERAEIAKEWSVAVGISEQEFRQMANVMSVSRRRPYREDKK